MISRVNEEKKVIVVLGQTATGKSDLAVTLAQKFNGEIISADSRQVYRGLDIGTGKITKKEMRGVPHHLLDIADPQQTFTVAEYKKLAEEKIDAITQRGALPIIVGGTGFYIDTLLGNITLSPTPPNFKLRKKLKRKTVEELFVILKKLNSRRAKTIDKHNPVRLIRAIEIAESHIKHKPHLDSNPSLSNYSTLKIGIKIPDNLLKEKIHTRLLMRIRKGMITEAKKLHKRGLSWNRMEELGLEYRSMARYLEEKISKKEMIQQLETAIWQYARRQKTWFKKDTEIHWYAPDEYKKIEKTISNFLKQRHSD